MDRNVLCTMGTLYALFVIIWNEKNGVHASPGCGSVVNDSLKSPGYPNNYPSNMDCLYSVPIPAGMTMNIYFADFDVEYSRYCSFDYLIITNEKDYIFGEYDYCGQRTGLTVLITGRFAVLNFNSDNSVQERGFLILFSVTPHASPKIILPDSAPVFRVLPGYKMTWSATGSPPIYTALIRNTKVLANTTGSVTMHLYENANYTCLATSEYGTDVRQISVVLSDCGPKCHQGEERWYSSGNTFSCSNFISAADMVSCAPTIADVMYVTSSNFSYLPVGIKFSDIGNLRHLYLISNNIQNLSSQHFTNLTNLKILDLSLNNITFLPDGIFAALPNLKELYLHSNGITFLAEELFANLTNLKKLSLWHNAIRFLPSKVFAKLTKLYFLDLSSNYIAFLPDGVFAKPTNLGTLDLSSNAIVSLPEDVFSSLLDFYSLDLSSNAITMLPERLLTTMTYLNYLLLHSNGITILHEEMFTNVTDLYWLDLHSNSITFLHERLFVPLTNIIYIELSSNFITFLPDGIFDTMTTLRELDLSSNALKALPNGVFNSLTEMRNLNLTSNIIQELPTDIFSALTELVVVYLSSNKIKSLPTKLFTQRSLHFLDLSSNNIQNLTKDDFFYLKELQYLDLSYNEIQHLPNDLLANDLAYLFLQNNMIISLSNETFVNSTKFRYLFLSANLLENIPYRSFYNLQDLQIIMLSDNPIRRIEPEAFRLGDNNLTIYLLRTELKILSLESFIGFSSLYSQLVIQKRLLRTLRFYSPGQKCTIYMSPHNAESEAIVVFAPEYENEALAYVYTLLASGFERHPENRTDYYKLLPCPEGTFFNSSSRGDQGCIKCPAGGFYSDKVGYMAKSCMKCPNGSFVSLDKAPGTRAEDCKACPQGTNTDVFAGFRACKCLDGFYRTHMLDKCNKCEQHGGLECRDDYAVLKPGYWWDWRSETYKNRYRNFSKYLFASLPAVDTFSTQYPYPMPTPHQCPRQESCKGGLDSPCETGYEGPLCAVCSLGFYMQLQACKQCPSKTWMMGQLSIIGVSLLLIVAISFWTSKRKEKKLRGNTLIDMILSKLKIVIGFYQVTYGLLEAFSFIKWPDSLQVIAKYSEILQMNILQVAPLHCFFRGLHVDAFASLFAITAINALVICFCGVAFGVRKLIIVRNQSLEDQEKTRRISETKQLAYRNVFFFLYVTYLSTCFKTASVLPLACQNICRHEKEELCAKYLKADYSVICHDPRYNQLVIVAYISTVYIFALPAASFIALWRQRRVILTTRDDKTPQGLARPTKEIITGLSFLFENYKPRSWYWELVEMSRKVIITSVMILVGQNSRSYIGLAWVIAGMYGVVFAWISPIQDVVENRLMVTSLAVTCVNLGIGAVSRIPAENIPASIDPYVDTIVFKILVVGANTSVIGLLVVQYAVHLYQYLKEWLQNPHWSFSCCLTMILPLADIHGELNNLAETSNLCNHSQAGGMELQDVLVSLKPGEEKTVKAQDDHCQEGDNKNATCHQETQTELFTLSVADIVVHGTCVLQSSSVDAVRSKKN